LTIGDHGLAALQAVGDDRLAADNASHRDGLNARDSILDHKDVGAGLADLDGFGRHGNSHFLAESHLHIYKRTGPEQLVRVWHSGPNRHRPSRHVDRVLNHGNLASSAPGIAGDRRLNGCSLIRQCLTQLRQTRLRQRNVMQTGAV
jgi:hypothetical protein